MATILVVDDRTTNRQLLVKLLSFAGYRVLEAPSGAEALGVAHEVRPDLIITDLVMPAMDGYEFARLVRANPLLGHTRVVFYTASHWLDETRKLAEASGVTYVIAKPTEPEQILQTIEQALQAEPPASLPPVSEAFHQEHMRLLTDKLAAKVDELEAEVRQRRRAEQDARENQARLAGIIETAMDAIISIDAGERITVFNQAAEAIFGYSAEAALGQPLSVLLPEHFREAHHKQIQQFGATGVTARAKGALPTLSGRRADGSLFPLEAAISQAIVGGQRQYTVILRDISERVRVERALAESEAQLRALFAAMTDVILVLDGEGHILQIAPTNPPTLYHPAPALLGQRLRDLLTAEPAAILDHSIRQALDSGQSVNFDYGQEIGGQTIWFSATISPMGAGQLLLLARDITSRKLAEQALRDSETHLRTLFDSAPISLWEEDFSAIKDYLVGLPAEAREDLETYLSAHPEVAAACVPLVKVLDVNQATLRLLEARDKSSLLGGLVAALTPESRTVFQQELLAIARGQTRLRTDAVVMARSGLRRETTLDWAVMPGHEARYTRVLLSLVDITERKQAEAALHQSEEQYRLLFERNPLPMWVYDLESLRFLDVNEAAIAHYGYNRGEFLGMTIADIRPPDDLPRLRANLAAEPLEAEHSGGWRHQRQDGSVIEVDIISHAIEFGGRAARLVLAQDVTERKRAEAQVQRQLAQMGALRAIDMAISANLDLRLTLQMLLEQVTSQLQVDAASVYLFNTDTHLLTFGAGRGLGAKVKPPATLRLGQPYAGRVALERKILVVPDLAAAGSEAPHSSLFQTEGFRAYVGVPLVSKAQVVGVLEVYHRAPLQPDQEWLDFLDALAGQAAIAIDNATLFDNLQISNQNLGVAYDATIEGWSRALDLRDRETEGHSQRVTDLTLRLAERMGLVPAQMVHVRRGSLLHDIGKMGVPDRILLKPGPLTDDEWVIMRQHPVFAYDLVWPIHYLRPALDIPYAHHEKWDGSGYPHGLKGEAIPLAARIFAVVDVWDALLSDRPYRAAWPEHEVRAYLAAQSGQHFDPDVAAAFQSLLRE